MGFFLDLLINGLLMGTLYSLIAVGLVFIFKASGVLNLAQGPMVLLAGFVVAVAIVYFGLPVWLAILIGIVVMVGLSFVVERLVLRPLVGQPHVSLIMATVGLMLFIEGVHFALGSIWPVFFLDIGVPVRVIEWGGMALLPINLIAAVIAGVLFGALGYLYMKTRTGVALRAVSDDHEAALSMGVSVRRLWTIVWMVAGMAALVAGLMWGTRMAVGPAVALIAFKALPVVIMGGLDSIKGAILGGLFIGAAENLVSGYLDPLVGGGTKEFFPYFLMIIVLWVKPYGLFGKEIIERV
jgi:branched-chain amino acid transport system permease protein